MDHLYARRLAALAVLIATLALPASAQAPIVVDSPGDGEPVDLATPDGMVTLREALIAANTNQPFGDAPAGVDFRPDRITFDRSLQTVTTTGFIAIEETVVIDGTVDSGTVVIQSNQTNPRLIFNVPIRELVTLQDITFRNGGGGGGNGGAVRLRNDGDLFVQRCRFEQNRSLNGGAIGVGRRARLRAFRTTFVQNRSRGSVNRTGGGAIYTEGLVELSDATFIQNQATLGDARGGAVFVTGTGTVTSVSSAYSSSGGTDVRFEDNRAAGAGGAIEAQPGSVLDLPDVDFIANRAAPAPGHGGAIHISGPATLSIEGGTITDNVAFGEGGGIRVSGDVVTSIMGTTISGNLSRGLGGGGLYAEQSPVLLTNVTLAGNRAIGAQGRGGGILHLDVFAERRAGLYVDVDITGNTASQGGGLALDGADVGARRVTITSNIAVQTPGAVPSGLGGGLIVSGQGRLEMTDSEILGNRAASDGGGGWVDGAASTLWLATSTIGENVAENHGGGLYLAGGRLDASRSLLRANQASRFGGAVYQFEGDLGIANSTISGNVARKGGGLYWNSPTGDNAFRSEFDFVTIAANQTVGTGAALFTLLPVGTVRKARVARSIIGDNVFGAGGEIGGQVTLINTSVESQSGVDPMLGPLADNGGPTMTHALLADSPYIDACATSAPQFAQDQRLADRVGVADCGAFEFTSPRDPQIATTSARLGETVRLDAISPNPLRGRAEVAFTVAETQSVQVSLYDVMGRRVQEVFAGTASAGDAVRAPVDASDLAAGVYVVVLQGESVRASQQVTVVR